MQTETYNPVRARNIAQEMADLQRAHGEGVTREDLINAGFTNDQIDAYAANAARIAAGQTAAQH